MKKKKSSFFDDFTSNPFKLIGMILLIIAIVGGISAVINYTEKSNSYVTACSDLDFTSAHKILQEIKIDINHKSAEMTESEKIKDLPALYQGYIDALLYVYGEEFKYLLDQNDPQAERRIYVLETEFGGEAKTLLTTFDGLARNYFLDSDKQPFYNLRDNLMTGVQKLSDYIMSVQKAKKAD